MKTLTLVLLLSSTAQAQTTYTVFFSEPVEVTETYITSKWVGDGEMKVKVWPDSPARLIVSGKDTTYAMTLYASDEKRIKYVYPYEDVELHGHGFTGGELNPMHIPDEAKDNRAILLLLLGLLLFI